MIPLVASTFSLLSILTILFVIPVQSIMLFEDEIATTCDPHFPTACWAPDIDSLCFTDSRLYLDAFHSTNKTKWALKSILLPILQHHFLLTYKLNWT